VKRRVTTDLRLQFSSQNELSTFETVLMRKQSETVHWISIFKRNLERLRQASEMGLFIGSWCR